jgi:SEFIR domain/NACHT domain
MRILEVDISVMNALRNNCTDGHGKTAYSDTKMTALMPRRLGLPARAQISNDDPKASVPQHERYEWLESRLREFKHLEPVNAQTVLEQRLPEQGVTVIVGEPGAGKSVLAATWREHFETQKRTCILLEGGSLEAKLESSENILLKMAEHPRAKVSNASKVELGKDSFPDRAMLIVDALDELPSTLDERLAAKILEVAQHHPVILTCRTAVWANRVKEKFTRIFGQTPQTYTLLGFTPDEQREFLNEWAKQHGIAAERAASVAAELQTRPQLSYLAANPLMLELIAQVTLELNKPVPDSRAELYNSAILELLNRSHLDGDLESWGTKYEPFMRALAMASVQANPNQDSQLETELDWDTVEQALQTARIPEAQHMPFLERLQRSGLVVRVGDKAIPKRRFIHLTLQEYALASAWLFGLRTPKTIQANDLSARLQDKLLEHWWQPNFESTLSLALSIVSKHSANLHDPIMAMLASWERGKPSALRIALHLVNAANISNEKVIDVLLEVLKGFELGTWFAAIDPECPKGILYKLTEDETLDIRQCVALNRNTPSSVFEQLAKDPDSNIRQRVAWNLNAPASALEQLSSDEILDVRRSVAGNPNAAVSTVEQLVRDPEMSIRMNAASNPNMPLNTLERIISGQFWIDCRESVREMNMPVNAFEELVQDWEKWARIISVTAASNPNIPVSTLEELVKGQNVDARNGAVDNPNMLANTLEELAEHSDWQVRAGVAGNPNTPVITLEKLAHETISPQVRKYVAKNLNTPANVLELFIADNDIDVRKATASNPHALTDTLERLSKDENSDVRRAIASNPNTPAIALEKLAKDDNETVRQFAAENLNMPPNTLEQFVQGKAPELCRGAAWNSNTPAHALEKLAQNESLDIRKITLGNSNYTPETHPNYPNLKRASVETVMQPKTNPRVFISYTHDSPEHDQRILEFSKTLRTKGIDAQIDQYQQNPEGGWPTWMSKQLQQADFIIMVFTQTYKRRFDNAEEPGKGLGGVWEGAVIIKNDLYARHGWDKKFIPVIFDPSDQQFIPLEFQAPTRYELPRDLERLVDYVRGHNPNAAPPLGSPTSD